MCTKHILAGLVLGPLAAFGQTKVDLGAQSRDIDFATMPFVRPFRTSTTLPTTCVTGEMFFDTAAPAGLNTYGCVSANTWALQGPGSVQGVAPIQVVLSSSTTLTIGAACSITTPCLSRLGSLVYSVTAPITLTVLGGSGLA